MDTLKDKVSKGFRVPMLVQVKSDAFRV